MSSFLDFVNNSFIFFKLLSESEKDRRLNVQRVEKLSDPRHVRDFIFLFDLDWKLGVPSSALLVFS